MRELTKKVLESGLIDKHIAALMERWGQLDEGASDLVEKGKLTKRLAELSYDNEKFIRKTLEDFIEDLEIFLQPESLERGITVLNDSKGE